MTNNKEEKVEEVFEKLVEVSKILKELENSFVSDSVEVLNAMAGVINIQMSLERYCEEEGIEAPRGLN